MMTQSKMKLNRFGVTLGLTIWSVLASTPAIAETTVVTTTSSNRAPSTVAIVLTPSLTSVRNDTSLVQEQGIDADRKLGWGGGVLFDAPLGEALSLGVGALYIQRKFQIGTGVSRLERKIPTVFLPVEAKIWLANIFSIGAGVFGALKVGDFTDSTVTGVGTLQSTSPADHETMEYGLTASANLLLPAAERTGVLIGARYLRGLSNGSKSGIYDERIDDLALQLGLSFSL